MTMPAHPARRPGGGLSTGHPWPRDEPRVSSGGYGDQGVDDLATVGGVVCGPVVADGRHDLQAAAVVGGGVVGVLGGWLAQGVPDADTQRCLVGVQVKHLTGISRANRTAIQVLTFAAGAHPGMDGSFEILRFPEPADPDAVYVQYRRGSIYLEENADVTAYADLFDHLRARALGPDESRALIERIARELT